MLVHQLIKKDLEGRIFRYDELSNIAPVHLKFWPEYMRVFVPRARGDIYREGNYACQEAR